MENEKVRDSPRNMMKLVNYIRPPLAEIGPMHEAVAVDRVEVQLQQEVGHRHGQL